jgi:LysR family transcriptional regulator, low CO2-responsive transcriptional regulator
MHYAQLRAFHAVAEQGGFSKAARSLSLTQPAVSDHVRRLEQDYGVQLFERTARGVELTGLGRSLFAVTRQMVGCERDARRLLESAGTLESGELTLVADAPDLAIRLIGAFRLQHPGIVVKLAIANATECMQRVLAGEADAAISAARIVHARLQTRVLCEEPLAAVVPAARAEAMQSPLSYEALVLEPVIFREMQSVTQQLLEAELVRKRLQVQPVLYVEGREALQTAIAQGVGVGVGVMAGTEYGGAPGIRRIPLADCQVRMVESLARLADRPPSNLLDALFATEPA